MADREACCQSSSRSEYVVKLRVDPPVKDESEAMQKAVGSDVEPASDTTVLTTVAENEAGTRRKRKRKPSIRQWRRRESKTDFSPTHKWTR
jgi:hypothetical protein